MKKFIFQITKFFLPLIKRILRTKKKNDTKIAIIVFKLLGDTVFTIPAIEYIRKHSDGKEIRIFCYEENKAIYELYFDNISYQTFNKKQIRFNTRIPNLYLTRQLRKFKPGLLFDLTCEYITSISSLLSGSNYLVGFNTYFFEGIFDTFTLKKEVPNLINMNLYPILKYYGGSINETIKEFPSNFEKTDRILIHPFAGWRAKEWGLEKFINLTNDLNKIYDVALICESKLLKNEKTVEIKNLNLNLILTDSISDLISEIKNSSVMISNDTGPIYIANLLGKATFTIYGPTNPKFHLPEGKYHEYIKKQIKCSPNDNEKYCYTYGGRYCQTFECMKSLEYSLVIKEIKKFLDSIGIEKSKIDASVKN